MRTNNRVSKRGFFTKAMLAMLMICFACVFTLVLSTEFTEVFDESTEAFSGDSTNHTITLSTSDLTNNTATYALDDTASTTVGSNSALSSQYWDYSSTPLVTNDDNRVVGWGNASTIRGQGADNSTVPTDLQNVEYTATMKVKTAFTFTKLKISFRAAYAIATAHANDDLHMYIEAQSGGSTIISQFGYFDDYLSASNESDIFNGEGSSSTLSALSEFTVVFKIKIWSEVEFTKFAAHLSKLQFEFSGVEAELDDGLNIWTIGYDKVMSATNNKFSYTGTVNADSTSVDPASPLNSTFWTYTKSLQKGSKLKKNSSGTLPGWGGGGNAGTTSTKSIVSSSGSDQYVTATLTIKLKNFEANSVTIDWEGFISAYASSQKVFMGLYATYGGKTEWIDAGSSASNYQTGLHWGSSLATGSPFIQNTTVDTAETINISGLNTFKLTFRAFFNSSKADESLAMTHCSAYLSALSLKFNTITPVWEISMDDLTSYTGGTGEEYKVDYRTSDATNGSSTASTTIGTNSALSSKWWTYSSPQSGISSNPNADDKIVGWGNASNNSSTGSAWVTSPSINETHTAQLKVRLTDFTAGDIGFGWYGFWALSSSTHSDDMRFSFVITRGDGVSHNMDGGMYSNNIGADDYRGWGGAEQEWIGDTSASFNTFTFYFKVVTYASTNMTNFAAHLSRLQFLFTSPLPTAKGTWSVASGTANTYGSAGGVTGDNDELNATHFDFPGTTGATSWTFTDTFRTVVPTTSNIAAFKEGGDTHLFVGTGEADEWYGGVTDANADKHVSMVVNFTLSEFLIQMINNTNVTVSASIEAAYNKRDGYFFYYGAIASPKPFEEETTDTWVTNDRLTGLAGSYFELTYANDGFSGRVAGQKTTGTYTTYPVTLTKDTPYLGLLFGNDYGFSISQRECSVWATSLKVHYTITLNNSADSTSTFINDGAAPVAANSIGVGEGYVKGSSGTGYAPNLNDTLSSEGWPVYYSSIVSELEKDNVANGKGTMLSYTNVALGSSPTTYYKYAQTEYVDTYNYSPYDTMVDAATAYYEDEDELSFADLRNTIGAGDRYLSDVNVDDSSVNLNWGTSGKKEYTSGIMVVTVGDTWSNMEEGTGAQGAVFGVYSLGDSGVSSARDIYVGGVVVGKATVKKINRARVVVSIYISQNAIIETEVKDFGERSTMSSIEVSGIDTKDPTSSASLDKSDDNYAFVATDDVSQAGVDWFRSQEFTIATDNVEEMGADGEVLTPYLWFYTVKKSTTSFADIPAPKIYTNYSAIKSADIQPVAAVMFDSFEYDFKTGLAMGNGGEFADVANDASIGNCTGAGYYCFTFYTCDLAGNLRDETRSYYVKVDYEAPTFELIFNDGEIAPSIDGSATWSKGDAKIEIDVDKLNLSGNMLYFEDYDGKEHEIVFNGTQIVSIDGVAVGSASNNGALVVTGVVNERVVGVSTVSNGDGAILTLTFEDSVMIEGVDTKQMFALDTTFVLYGGDTITDLMSTDSRWDEHGTMVYVDNGAPMLATLTNEDIEYVKNLVALDKSAIGADKAWYTARNGVLGAILNFYDEASETDFGNQVTVYYGTKQISVSSDGDFGSEIEGLESFFANFKNIDSSTYKSYFDTLGTIAGDVLSSDGTDVKVDLRSNLDAGLRVTYVWAVDQAGNICEAVSRYYVLYDSNTYAIQTQLKDNTVLGNTASIVAQNADGEVITSAMRGEKIYLNIEFADEHVPYSLVTTLGGRTYLLENKTQYNTWTNVAPSFVVMDEASVDAPIGFTLDHATNLNKLQVSDEYNTVGFQLAHRKVIEYMPTLMVLYNGTKTVVPMTYNDDLASSHFEYLFKDSLGRELYCTADAPDTVILKTGSDQYVYEGGGAYTGEESALQNFVPSIPGNYSVNIIIPDGDASFVAYDRVGEDGEAIWRSYTITKGQATITAVATTSSYGDMPQLEWTVSGTTKEYLTNSGANVLLALNTSETDWTKLGAGTYQIVSSSTGVEDNKLYDINFVSNYHTVAKRVITIGISGGTKIYGNVDPGFTFTVDKTQFASGQAYTDLFSVAEFGTPSELENVLSFTTTNKITRQEGENVGEYQFVTSDSSAFNVNDNYRVVMQANGQFVITKRTIELDASNQFEVKQLSAGFDKNASYTTIVPSYILRAEDAKFASEIVGNLALTALVGEEGESADYSATYVYSIGLGTIEDTFNITFKLKEGVDNTYIVYIALPGTASISLKDGVAFSAVYGSGIISIPFDLEKFDVSIEDEGATVYTTVVWTANVTANVAVGTYNVPVTGATLYNGDTPLTNKVVVEPFNITITPATIVVSALASSTSKIYGEQDSAYGIGWQVVSINGIADLSSGYAGATLEDIKGYVSGTFARACYDASGNFKYFGNRTDDVTVDGLVYGTTDYYGYAVNGAFVSSNANYQVEPQFDSEARFAINKATITLSKNDFVGTNKNYDGTTSVIYSAGTRPVNFAQEGVELSYAASYDSYDIGERTITFTNLGLTGERGHNYTLVLSSGLDYVTIDLIEVGGSKIQIFAGYIHVSQASFTIQKEYDKTTEIAQNHVILGNVPGAEVLYQVAQAGNVIVESGAYSGVEVSNNYNVTTLTIFYIINKVDQVDFSNQGVYPNIIVEKIVNGDVNGQILSGARITLINQKASIVKRVLDAASFETMDAVDREYNSKDDATFSFTFTDGALVAGDSLETLNLTITGKTINGEKDFGANYAVEFVSYNEDDIDSHYTLDIDSLNNYYTGDKQIYMDIQRAKLMPNVSFVEKEYDGTSNVTVSDNSALGEDIPELTTLHYAEELNSELMCFGYDIATTAFALSKDGELDGNIVMDEQGNVILHNVRVSNLVITETGSNNYLRNYELYGARYVDGTYMSLGTLESGTTIDAYELIGAANITKREVVINTNDVTIKNKVYDGTRTADVTILLENNAYVVEKDRDLLKVNAQAEFARRQVGDNIDVEIFGVALDVIDQQNAYLLNNYLLKNYALTGVKRSIKPRAIIASEITLGDSKVYDGTAKVESSSVSYAFEGMIDADVSSYRVSLANGGAYFVDKNVEVDDEGNAIAKGGNIFNPALRNIKGNTYINYVLALKDEYRTGEQYYAYELDGKVVYVYDTQEVTGADCYYYPLEQTTKYIVDSVENAENIQSAKDAGAFVGAYYNGATSVYLVKESFTGTISGNLDEAVTYMTGASGIMQKRQISISKVEKIIDDKFTKLFDGTDKFYGVNGTDYRYDASNIINMIKGDDITIAGVEARFDSVNAGVCSVLFSATGVAGADKNNYTYNTISATRISAKIKPLDVTAKLNDSALEYGKRSSAIVGDITYSMGGYPLNIVNNTAYMRADDFLKHVGFYDASGALINASDEVYVSMLKATLYSLENGEFIENGAGEYVKLAGTISKLPQATANIPSKASAGTEHDLTLTAGDAQNLSFVAQYTDVENSTLTIVKKTIYVAVQNGDYTKLYGTAHPAKVNIVYMDATGSTQGALVSGDTPASVFKTLPTATFGLYYAGLTTPLEIVPDAKISADLEAGQFYVAYIDVTDFEQPDNYEVVFGTLTVDGEIITYKYSETFSVLAPQLSIVLPTIENVSISSADKIVTYNRDVQTASVVSGVKSTDSVYFVIDGQEVEAKNAGVYEGKILIKRDVKIDENDTNGYFVTWESEDVVKLTINKAKPGLKAENDSYTYTGNVFAYDTQNITVSEADKVDGFSYAPEDIAITYEKLVDGAFVEADEVKGYGIYRVTIELTSHNDNYLSDKVRTQLSILKAVVNVTITTTELEAIYQEGGSYGVDYTIGENTMGITKANTAIKYFRGENEAQINSAGRYQFRVVLTGDYADVSENYNLVGGQGNYDLTINTINSYDKQDELVANVTLNDNKTMLADKLEARYVYETNASSADTLYFASMQQFVGDVSKVTGVDATLQTVVRLSMQYGENKVALDGKTSTVSIKLTDDVVDKMDEIAIYQLSKDGTLVKLEGYQIEDGTLSYTTDYLGSIAFVRLGTDGSPAWVTYAVAGGIAGAVLVAAIVVVSIIAKRRKVKNELDALDD